LDDAPATSSESDDDQGPGRPLDEEADAPAGDSPQSQPASAPASASAPPRSSLSFLASIASIASILSSDLGEADSDGEDDDDDDAPECAICLSPFVNGEVVCESNNPLCPHVYHRDCLEPWLLRHEHCPVCREVYLAPRRRRPAAAQISGDAVAHARPVADAAPSSPRSSFYR
jgi:hypothetical protein